MFYADENAGYDKFEGHKNSEWPFFTFKPVKENNAKNNKTNKSKKKKKKREKHNKQQIHAAGYLRAYKEAHPAAMYRLHSKYWKKKKNSRVINSTQKKWKQNGVQ